MRIIGGELGQIWRSLIRRPGYAAVVVLTLALGIGVTTTIYSVVDAMLVRPLPYRHAERLVVIGNTVPGQEWVGARDGLQRIERIAAANFLDLSRRVSVFEQAAASLLFRSFVELKTEHLGFKPEKLVAFNIPLKTERPWEAWDALLLQLQAIPGVTAAAAASNLPFQTPDWMPRVERSDQVGEAPSAGIPGYAVSPSFFATAGVPILKGRPFDGSDQPDSRGVAIVNATFARGTFGDRNAIGERIRVSGFDGPARELEIVGVAGDVVQGRVENGISPSVYVPHTQQMAGANFVIASDRDLGSLGPDIRRAVAVTPFAAMPLRDLSSMESRIEVSRAGPRFQVLLIGAFAIAALLLSAVGLYGTLAFTVRSRTKELGIRMVMGAGQASIYGLVLRQGLVVLGIGTAAGLAGAVGLTRLLQGFLYGIGPFDPVAFVAGIAVVAGAVLLAALRPAGRAARIDPMSSLRAEG